MVKAGTFAERLRHAVVAGGGPTKVAHLSGIPLTTLNNYLAGRSEPKRPALVALAQALRSDIGWLAEGAESANDGAARPAPPKENSVGGKLADGELLAEIVEAMIDLYTELGLFQRRRDLGRRCARIHNAIVAAARENGEQRAMVRLAVALERQNLSDGEEGG